MYQNIYISFSIIFYFDEIFEKSGQYASFVADREGYLKEVYEDLDESRIDPTKIEKEPGFQFIGAEFKEGSDSPTSLQELITVTFDSIVDTGSVQAIKLAVNGLKQQYEQAVGYEGTMYTGKAPSSSKDVYRSQAELVAAMSDTRYDNDPAYRQDVIAKLERSDNLTF